MAAIFEMIVPCASRRRAQSARRVGYDGTKRKKMSSKIHAVVNTLWAPARPAGYTRHRAGPGTGRRVGRGRAGGDWGERRVRLLRGPELHRRRAGGRGQSPRYPAGGGQATVR